MILVIWVGFREVSAQSTEVEFKGVILDSATNEPVAYATIKVLDSIGGGVYSNEQGKFNIEIEAIHSSVDSINTMVQFLCYEDVRLTLYRNSKKTIRLIPILDCDLNFLPSCKFDEFPKMEPLKPKAFKGFGTKFLE